MRDIIPESLQSYIGIAFQEAFLFNTTILENIRLGKLDATHREIEIAAEKAEINQIIESFPQGYDTIVGERGCKLSGGQRQRIALARLILRNPAILLLDEVTASLDSETEAAINKTINRIAKGRTLIAVTHRLASAMNADRIFVLEKGKLVEQGSHQELLALDRLYARLWVKQTSQIEKGYG
jgi:ATP-binding cassette subfamily B protein